MLDNSWTHTTTRTTAPHTRTASQTRHSTTQPENVRHRTRRRATEHKPLNTPRKPTQTAQPGHDPHRQNDPLKIFI